MAEILQIPAPMVGEVWPEAAPHLAESIAMTNGRFEPEDVKRLCEGGHMQLWLIGDDDKTAAAAVTEIVDYPRKRYARVVFVGGAGAKDWHADLEAALQTWSKGWKCDGLEAFGRKGWGRLIHAEQIAVMLTRDYPTSQEVH